MENTLKIFLKNFKEETESRWAKKEEIPDKYGFQIQKGTKWLGGHNKNEIDKILSHLSIHRNNLNKDILTLLEFTRGLDLPLVNYNVYNADEPVPQYYDSWKLNEEYICGYYPNKIEKEDISEITKQSDAVDFILPIYSIRYLVLSKNGLKIYSVYGDDVIIYGESLQDYLTKEFLPDNSY